MKNKKGFKEAEKEFLSEPVSKTEMVAKKDFEIHHNDYHRVIKAGEDLKDVPILYWENLKTEEVL